MATPSFNLTIIIPTEDYEERQQSWHSEPESIKAEGQGSFKLSAAENFSNEERISGKKRKAEAFEKDLPLQPTKYYAILNTK